MKQVKRFVLLSGIVELYYPSMDGVITFSHDGQDYTADVISSDNLLPHYHWVMFNSPEMQKALGDDVAFVEKEGKLKSIHPSRMKKNNLLLQTIKAALEKHLGKEISGAEFYS